MYVWSSCQAQRVRSPGAGVADDSELPYGFSERAIGAINH